MTKLHSKFFQATALFILCIAFSQNAFAQEKKPKKKRTPIAAIISAPEGKTLEPSESKVISSVEQASTEKESEETSSEVLTSPKGKIEGKTEILTAPTKELKPVPSPTKATKEESVKKSTTQIIRAPGEVKKTEDQTEAKEVIRSVKDVVEE